MGISLDLKQRKLPTIFNGMLFFICFILCHLTFSFQWGQLKRRKMDKKKQGRNSTPKKIKEYAFKIEATQMANGWNVSS